MVIKPNQTAETETDSIARIAQASVPIVHRFYKPPEEPKSYYYVENPSGMLERVKAMRPDTSEVSRDFHTVARRIKE